MNTKLLPGVVCVYIYTYIFIYIQIHVYAWTLIVINQKAQVLNKPKAVAESLHLKRYGPLMLNHSEYIA